ncbi:PREDICTED: chymotrypsin-2-like [Ceratosolen solmsi marchali]|uniref:Chymotrypsin-2-like n=1 Tax=Ceratosolen solmsi marchali TaxID=326594 RepID=A0AAJ6YUU2_9HYME|nr:PREDICTED: chymotrypsin-2-like [Ceratosolen solmsi marchali]
MRLFSVICTYLALIFIGFAVAFKRQMRVIGGTDANIMEFPHQVSLRLFSNNKHYCSGSIITNKHILTAAHCLYRLEAYYSDTRIYTGCTNRKNTTGSSYRIQNVFIHPHFTGELITSSMFRHDIAIIEVVGVIEFSEIQKMAKLPTRKIRIGEIAEASGWSLTSPTSNTIFSILQKAPMRIMSNIECMQKNPIKLYKGQFCAFLQPGVGICTYDSGGPLTSNGIIIGIISFCVPCAVGLPDVYTDIYYYLDFIKSITNI